MDKYRPELIRILQANARKWDYTIVFEDMDRLPHDFCVRLMSDLHELNEDANRWLKSDEHTKKTLRFLYVINDSMFADSIQGVKFFDYEMPIYPSANPDRAKTVARNYFSEINSYGGQMPDCLAGVAHLINDYRMLKNIINDYNLLCKVFCSKSDEKNVKLDSVECEQVMALAIYKNVLPEDYDKIKQNESFVFKYEEDTESKIPEYKIPKQDDLKKSYDKNEIEINIQNIINKLIVKGSLSAGCTRFIGSYSVNDTKLIKSHLKWFKTRAWYISDVLRFWIQKNYTDYDWLFCPGYIMDSMLIIIKILQQDYGRLGNKDDILNSEGMKCLLHSANSYDLDVKDNEQGKFEYTFRGLKLEYEQGKAFVTFGRYRQGQEEESPIRWRILDTDSYKVLLISEKMLDMKIYDNTTGPITWEKSSLRDWLNNDFLRAAFSADEQKIIAVTNVTIEKNHRFGNSPEQYTQDNIFLLSIDEAEKYFKDNEDRLCTPTDYATGYAAFDYSKVPWLWWLRSPGSHQKSAIVDYDGSVDYYLFIHGFRFGVRPALWLNLNAEP